MTYGIWFNEPAAPSASAADWPVHVPGSRHVGPRSRPLSRASSSDPTGTRTESDLTTQTEGATRPCYAFGPDSAHLDLLSTPRVVPPRPTFGLRVPPGRGNHVATGFHAPRGSTGEAARA